MATTYAAVTITITASGLGAGAARQSEAIVSDTANNINDYRVSVRPTASAGTPTGSKAVFVWVAVSDDAGASWMGNATGTDSAITLDSPHQFFLGCVIPFPTTTLARGGDFSLKAACGGSIPANWSIIIENQIGFAFSALTVACKKEYNT